MAPLRRTSSALVRLPVLPDAGTLTRVLEAAGDVAVVGFAANGAVASWLPGAEALLGSLERGGGRDSFAALHGSAIAAELFATAHGTLAEGASAIVQARTAAGHTRALSVSFAAAEPAEAPVAWWGIYRERIAAPPTQDGSDNGQAERLRELLVNTVESLHTGLCILELTQDRVLFVNEAFVKITGFHRVEVIGNPFDCSLAEWPELRGCLLPHIDALRTRGREAGSAHWEVELPSGVKTLEVYGQPIFAETGKPSFLLLVFEDITERQQLSNQLVQSEKLAAIGQLAAGIAHEMRSPLATIYNALYIIRAGIDPKNMDMQENIGIAVEEIERVQEIIVNLLDFARESKRESGVTNVNDTIERTLRIIRKDLENRNIKVVTEFSELPPGLISPNALKQILINLLTNAIQAMPQGGTLTIGTCICEPGTSRGGPMPGMHYPPMAHGDPSREQRRRQILESVEQEIGIRVGDTGCGIAPEVLPMIFNPFFTTKEPGAGTGLGLSVVHSQVRDHGGQIWVASTLGRGTTFRIKIPAAPREENEAT